GLVEDPRSAARQPEVLAAGPVRSELETQESRLAGRLEDDRPGAVPEKDERRAVFPVENAREQVAADDERLLRQAARDHPVCLRDRVDEPGATGGEVIGGGLGRPEPVG